jgi:hypothetical protein
MKTTRMLAVSRRALSGVPSNRQLTETKADRPLPDIERKQAAYRLPPLAATHLRTALGEVAGRRLVCHLTDDYREGKRRPAAASSSF